MTHRLMCQPTTPDAETIGRGRLGGIPATTQQWGARLRLVGVSFADPFGNADSNHARDEPAPEGRPSVLAFT